MTLASAYQIEVVSLRNRVADLQEEVRVLNRQLAPSLVFPKEWRLNPAERRIVSSLYAAPNGFRATEALLAVISRQWAERDGNLLKVRMSLLRKKIAENKIGIIINTVHGEGYEMPKGSREIVRRAVEMAVAA